MASTNHSGDSPVDGKSDFEVSGSSAGNSDTEVHKSGGNGKNYLTFAAAGVSGDHYRPVETYEGIHRYDPDFRWEPAEEKRVLRKIDKRICTWVCLMFFALQLDRGNISQALSDNMLDDLNMNTNDYNYGQTIFYLCFLSAELPSQLISKKLGPDNWIPIQMVSWSLIASFQAFLSGRKSFFACRALLGLVEGGFIPDNILYLSYFYTGWELPGRLSWFWVSYQSTQIISAFLAFGILRLRGHNGLEGWRYLFALEGMLTGLIGIASWFYLPPSPTQTASKTWNPFRGKSGWFNEREEKIMVNRILRDDPTSSHTHEALTRLIKLQIPAYVLFILQLLFWTYISERFNERFLVSLISQVWALPLLVAFEVLPAKASPWARWALSSLLVGHPYVHAILVAITSRNAGTVRTRTVASAMYNMCVQASSIISQNIYRNDDKPLYRRGNKVLLGICAYNFALFIGAKLFYVAVNKKERGFGKG
ncbi:hypothetical protein P3342_005537 [Pyrenophora teres f. teres]|nr:hypothetical protein P3342_005537 [Pyrenophora teres f. teres]